MYKKIYISQKRNIYTLLISCNKNSIKALENFNIQFYNIGKIKKKRIYYVYKLMLDKFLKQIEDHYSLLFKKKNEYIPTTKVIYRHVAFHTDIRRKRDQ